MRKKILHKKGMVLVTVLMITIVITITISGLIAIVNNDVSATYRTINDSKLNSSCESGIFYGLKWLRNLTKEQVLDINGDNLEKNDFEFDNDIELSVFTNYEVNLYSNKKIWSLTAISQRMGKTKTIRINNIDIIPFENSTDYGTSLNYDHPNWHHNEYVDIKNADMDLSTNKLSVMSWIKLDETDKPRAFEYIISKRNISDNSSKKSTFTFCYLRGKQKFQFYVNLDNGLNSRQNVVTVNLADDPLEFDKWYHVAGTYDGQYLKFYLNGELVASRERAGNIVNTNDHYHQMTIADTPYQDKRFRQFKGNIDEVAIWNNGLNEDEIKTAMNSHPNVDDENLQLYMNFDEGAGKKVFDLSKYKRTGKLADKMDENDWEFSDIGGTGVGNQQHGENSFTTMLRWEF